MTSSSKLDPLASSCSSRKNYIESVTYQIKYIKLNVTSHLTINSDYLINDEKKSQAAGRERHFQHQ